MKNLVAFILVSVFSVSCAHYPKLEPDFGKEGFKAESSLDAEHVEKEQNFDNMDQVEFVVLGTASRFPEKFHPFMKSVLNKLGFNKIFSGKELEEYLIANQVALDVDYGELNSIALHKISKKSKPFMVVRATHLPINARHNFIISVMDPRTGKTVYEAGYRGKTAWVSSEKEIVRPVINHFAGWVTKQKKAN